MSTPLHQLPPPMRSPILIAVAVLALAGPALAQGLLASSDDVVLDRPTARVDMAPGTISARVLAALESSSPAVRAEALHAVVTLAYSAEGVDLRPAVPALLDIFQTDSDESHRILALRALETSESDGVMGALRSEAGREPCASSTSTCASFCSPSSSVTTEPRISVATPTWSPWPRRFAPTRIDRTPIRLGSRAPLLAPAGGGAQRPAPALSIVTASSMSGCRDAGGTQASGRPLGRFCNSGRRRTSIRFSPSRPLE